MSTTKVEKDNTADREIVTSRIFDAPRELVWEAWTNPRHVVNWWGPRGFSTTIEVMDVRPGGVWRHVMRGPDGAEYPNQSVFIEVVKPERIVYNHGGSKVGEKGVSFVATWTFEDLGGKTRLTIRSVFPTAEAREFIAQKYGAVEGAKQTLERLGEHLAALASDTPPFVISRVFDAPRELVWKAFSDPEHMKQWWGPKGFAVRVAKMDFRSGGSYLYCLRSPDGRDLWGKFAYREIVPPERMVLVNSFSDENGGLTRHPMSATWPLEMLSTFTFVERGGKTELTIQWQPINTSAIERQTFDNGRASMTQGWGGTLDQLTAYLAKAKDA